VKDNKRKALKHHATSRFSERFGITLTKELESNIIKNIQKSKDSVFVLRESNIKTIWKVKIISKEYLTNKEIENECFVVYDSSRKCLVTVLPKETNQQYQQILDYKGKV
jgi:hypothetical protein